jgi:hypothetical protein
LRSVASRSSICLHLLDPMALKAPSSPRPLTVPCCPRCCKAIRRGQEVGSMGTTLRKPCEWAVGPTNRGGASGC